MFRGIHTTVIGDSHVKKGIVCQDSSGVYVEDEFAVAAVAVSVIAGIMSMAAYVIYLRVLAGAKKMLER